MSVARRHDPSRRGLYTEAERQRRDSSRWTMVQAVLAPLQFFIFLVSLGLVIRTLLTGEGTFAAHSSILLKTFALYTIMVTGSLWEKDVFGQYLFAPAFFWEDVVSFGVAPAYLMYELHFATAGPAAWIFCYFYVMGAAIRLRKTDFRSITGTPSASGTARSW